MAFKDRLTSILDVFSRREPPRAIVGVLAGIGMARRAAPLRASTRCRSWRCRCSTCSCLQASLTALAMRRHRESHKRLMLLAYASLLGAPAARLPGVLPLGP